MSQRFYSPRFAAALKTQLMLKEYDLVQIESLEMASYLPTIQASRSDAASRRPIRVIYDSFNAEFDLQRLIYEIDRRNPSRLPAALYSLVQWRPLTGFELDVCPQVELVVA